MEASAVRNAGNGQVSCLGDRFWRVLARTGFACPRLLRGIDDDGLADRWSLFGGIASGNGPL
jgi:hypothetical protein